MGHRDLRRAGGTQLGIVDPIEFSHREWQLLLASVRKLEDHRLRGDARRLTSHPTDDLEPALSSDGSQVVFRSEREGGAIYVLPIATGPERYPERYLVPLGRRPRFSPDGRRVAYWTGHIGGAVSGALFVVATEGGEPTPIVPQFVAARSPVWSPDGQTAVPRS